ncbi:4-hydroxybenzoate transporter PcaK [Dickeya solani]|nr:4-hydroxybenzoate transporter PcaK [Dickeya solani]
MDRVNPHLALGMIYAAGGVATAMIGLTHAYFVMLAVVAFSSGFCLNGANTGMNALSARYYPTEARATGSGWMHGVGRMGAIMSAFAGAQVVNMGMGADHHVYYSGYSCTVDVADDSCQRTIRL